jgi:hypothetical protein
MGIKDTIETLSKEAKEHLAAAGHFIDDTIVEKTAEMYEKSKDKFQDFLRKIEQEGVETKRAFVLLNQATFEDRKLTEDEKKYIENQMKDVLKTVGLVGIAALPGGSLVFILSSFLHLNKYVLPTAFLKPEDAKK